MQAALHDALGSAIEQYCQIVGSHDSDQDEPESDTSSASDSDAESDSESESGQLEECDTSDMHDDDANGNVADEGMQKQNTARQKRAKRKEKQKLHGMLCKEGHNFSAYATA